ncbi:MAG TPA: DoxX family protein [Lacunisphaera sp.]|jgi:putative oxidoreductase|nr:DoxX family protein [Lacunisphaera sp.]HQY05499.1 DoxX family protein [Lacunisphaera sp.]
MQLRPLLAKFDGFAAMLQSPLLLVIRLYWGVAFAQTGWGKLMNLDRTAGFFESLNIPLPKLNAALAGATECGGGLLLALGLFARPVAVPLIFTMLVAYATADREALMAITSDPDKFFGAAPFLFLFAALLVLVFGPGKWSLDQRGPRRAGQE